MRTGRSLTRLAIGGAMWFSEAVLRRLETWEYNRLHPDEPPLSTEPVDLDELATRELPPAGYAVIGMIFAAQERLSRTASLINRAQRMAGRLLGPVIRPLMRSPIGSPLRSGVNQLVQRGEEAVDSWINLGKQEAEQSTMLVQTAVNRSVDSSINYLANNPEVQELVQTQSTGLVNEIIEEIRERTFSADVVLEETVRRILRLTPRHQIPGPPMEIRQTAAIIHPHQASRKDGA